ncbi:hypothetical protein B0H17DRAFT_1089013 [Mycena rosella]|uniref:Uncharacterized protein n=1 Tax=Mycena rosella TaxID=1033263 RepID=A0AAD7G4N0_MYCRO|nr:hypothetical protein B0H17DRAFT_1089013 [Mycena rosella]
MKPESTEMKTEADIKTEPMVEADPITAAATALALAMGQAQRKITALENAATVAHRLVGQRDAQLADKASMLATSQSDCKSLETRAQNECTALRSQFSALQDSVGKEREAWAKERETLRTSKSGELETLKAERARLEMDQVKFAAAKSANLTSLKRTLGVMQAEVSKQERSAAGPASTKAASRKRQRVQQVQPVQDPRILPLPYDSDM